MLEENIESRARRVLKESTKLDLSKFDPTQRFQIMNLISSIDSTLDVIDRDRNNSPLLPGFSSMEQQRLQALSFAMKQLELLLPKTDSDMNHDELVRAAKCLLPYLEDMGTLDKAKLYWELRYRATQSSNISS